MLDYCVQTTGSSYVDDRTCTHEASIAESKSAISLHESTLSCRVSWQPCWTHMLHNVDTLNVDMLLERGQDCPSPYGRKDALQ